MSNRPLRGWVAYLACCGFWAAAGTAAAQWSYPMLMGMHPVAVQQGGTTEHEVTARYNLYGAYQVLIEGEGLRAEVVPPPEAAASPAKPGEQPADPKAKPSDKPPAAPAAPAKKPEQPKLKLRFTADKQALPGVRDFRIATPQGVSTIGQVVIVREPVVVEGPKNDTLADATAVTLPACLCGTVERNEDVDLYKFRVEAGSTWTFHVRGARLEDKIHDLQTHLDPLIALKNSSGTVVALADNYFFGDPLLSHRFEQGGEYYLEVRDVRYQGNPYWHYAVEVTDRPFVTQVFPLAVRPGESTTVELVGTNLPSPAAGTITLDSEVPEGLRWVQVQLNGELTNSVPVLVTRAAHAAESSEPNETREQAQAFVPPAVVCGRLNAPGDIDYFALQAKKGERYSFEVLARRYQSDVDPGLAVFDAKGTRLVENDDAAFGRHTSADSLIENWTVPADGTYYVEVRDLHLRGGPAFVYALRVAAAEPYFLLEADTDKTLLAPGMNGVVFVRAYRKNGFAGDIQLHVDGLPRGVTARTGRILAGGNDGCIVLQASAEAPQGAANVRVWGTADHALADGKQVTLQAQAQPLQEIYLPGGGRGNYPVNLQTVSVGDPMDLLAVHVSPREVTLKPGEKATLTVKIERAEGFDKNVTLDVVQRHLGGVYGNSLPPGVTMDDKQGKVLLTGKTAEGQIVLAAADDAKPVEKQLVPVMAHVAINFVMKSAYVAEPVLVTVQAK